MKRLLTLCILLLAVMTAAAQDKYYAQRASQFEVLPVHSNSLVFLGDGNTEACEWHEMFCNRHIKNRGIRSDRSSWLVNRLDTIVGARPKKVFLSIGINDLMAGEKPDAIAGNIDRILTRFEKESPWTRIYLTSLLPTNPALSTEKIDLKEQIEETNRLLEALCTEERKNLQYIDVYSTLIDDQRLLDPKYTNDGLHLTGEGYLRWKEEIEKYVK